MSFEEWALKIRPLLAAYHSIFLFFKILTLPFLKHQELDVCVPSSDCSKLPPPHPNRSPFIPLSQYSKPVLSSINTMWATYWILKFYSSQKVKNVKTGKKWTSILLFNSYLKIFQHLINVKKYFTSFSCSSALTFWYGFYTKSTSQFGLATFLVFPVLSSHMGWWLL